ncbi:MAG: hypothetical protein ACRDFB_07790 [Rhabdochlamydiaceae bacterium]
MKTMHLAIITGIGITVFVILGLMFLYLQTQTNTNLKPVETKSNYSATNNSTSNEIHITKFSKLENLSQGGNSEYGFQWSHDGKFIVLRECPGTPPSCSLEIMKPDGEKVDKIEIPKQFIYVYGPKISPSDNSILFGGDYNTYNGSRFTTHSGLFKYVIKQKNLVEVEDGQVWSYDWAPDGNIVFVKYNDTVTCLAGVNTMACANRIDDIHSIIWLANPNGTKIRKLYNGTDYFSPEYGGLSVSPDGTKIVVVNSMYVYSYKNLYRLAVLDVAKKEITPLTEYSKIYYSDPVWSPDGKSIVYTALDGGQVKGQAVGEEIGPAGWLGMISPDGSNSNNIIFGNTTSPYDPPPISPAISPDGKTILFAIDYDFYNGPIQGPGIYEIELNKPL